MSEEKPENKEEAQEQQKERGLTPLEENWALHSFAGIPYHEAKKIDDPEERQFLLVMAAHMKHSQEQEKAEQLAREQAMTKDFESQLQSMLPKGEDGQAITEDQIKDWVKNQS